MLSCPLGLKFPALKTFYSSSAIIAHIYILYSIFIIPLYPAGTQP